MKKLIKGLREFKSSYFSTHLDLFENLAHGQEPRVLFITCSDSRIDPNLITQADIGDLFVIRNAGNIIPPYGAANGGEGAAVEYAIQALNIQQVVVCGHSHCGAMKGLLALNKLQEKMPLVYDWLKHAEATRRLVQDSYSDYEGEELLEVAIAENVLTQIENLKTYPIVHSRLYQGKLKIYGWIYHLETGEVLAYDAENHAYVAPQSQILDEGFGGTLKPGQLISTNAPPVACGLPQHLDDLPVQPAPPPRIKQPVTSGNGSRQVRSEPSESKDANPLAAPWLSPTQADRIYRGSNGKN
ncbi:MAG: carbonic anhydrase [Aphanocapsa sp. GSE-SYN-MK-11-07L]|jgi:carbonic anhydrase|nr:carbonic anhydrase [Aphanocapsa sp. GSE-SYN-MK-11-07L]